MLQQPERLRTQPHEDDRELVSLVRAGAAGDPVALRRLVARFERMLRHIARSYGLSSWDTDDVLQATWLQFLQHGGALREPAAVSGWLATTARRQSMQVLRGRTRERLTEDPACHEASDQAEPEREVLDTERTEVLHRALDQLPKRQRSLMGMLVSQPELSYEEVGRLLVMPVGSIGPTRARSLDRLRGDGELQALQAACV
jgi:RNA polymerase sigma factor (sigma-70 family)